MRQARTQFGGRNAYHGGDSKIKLKVIFRVWKGFETLLSGAFFDERNLIACKLKPSSGRGIQLKDHTVLLKGSNAMKFDTLSVFTIPQLQSMAQSACSRSMSVDFGSSNLKQEKKNQAKVNHIVKLIVERPVESGPFSASRVKMVHLNPTASHWGGGVDAQHFQENRARD